MQPRTPFPAPKQTNQTTDSIRGASRQERVAETRSRLLGLPKRRSPEIVKALETFASFPLTLQVPSRQNEKLMQLVEVVFVHDRSEKGGSGIRVLASDTPLFKRDQIILFKEMPANIKAAYDEADAKGLIY